MIGGGLNLALGDDKGIVVFAAGHIRHLEPGSKFQPLYGGNPINNPSNPALHAAEHGVAPPGGKSGHIAADYTAHAVFPGSGLCDSLAHSLPGGGIYHRKVFPNPGKLRTDWIQRFIGNAADGIDFGGNENAHSFQPLFTKPSCNAQRGCQPSGKMTASRHILKALVLDLGGVVCVARPGGIQKIAVIFGAGVVIVNHSADGSAAGVTVHNAAEKLRGICFLPGGGVVVLSRGSPVEEGLQLLQVHRKTGGNPIQTHTDGRGVGLPENGQFQMFTVGTAHSGLLTSRSPPRRRGKIFPHTGRPEWLQAPG